ncbi:MAG TPA: tetratricopeptide repeat protein [Spirochaetota bacterium]|nr:tetratricopeptide repeat protein [Spirochaetota bacterium]HOL56806.1 tetratricopeptide repeat protein [Spirochaetota bacterium]HPP05222.1 tetratricopeptide repeat protein [Spirochaetota bacterium]
MKKGIALLFFLLNFFYIFSLSSENSLLDVAINDYKKGQYEFAINNFKKFIQFSSDNINKPKAYYYLALCYYYLENYRMSLNYLNELISKYRVSSYSNVANFWKGLIYQNLKDWEKAFESFDRYINLYPQTELVDRAYFSAANSLFELNRLSDAERYLKIIIDRYKKSEKYEEASVLYAYILIKSNKKDKAKEFLSYWMERLGKTGEKYEYRDRFWLYYAEILIEEKNYEEARIILKKIDLYSKNSPSSDIALLRLSQIETLTGNEKESKQYIIRLNNEYPLSKYNIDATLNTGISEYINGNYENAINFFNIVNIAITKKLEEKLTNFEKERFFSIHSNSLFYSGEAYYRLNNTSTAKEKFLELIAKNYPLRNKAIIRVLDILFEEKNFKELEKSFNTYEKFFNSEDSEYENFVIYRSKYLYYINKNKESLEILDKIKENNKNFLILADLKSKNFIKLNEIEKGLKILIDAFPYIPLNKKSYYAYEISSLYFNISQYDKALEFYNISKSFLKDSENREEIEIRIEYIKALCFMENKEYTKAIESFNNIIKINNNKLKEIINNSYYYLAWCYYKISNFNDSAKFFALASNVITNTILVKDSSYMEAMSYFSNKDYNTAYLKFEFIYKKYYPDEIGVMAFYYMAKSLENSGKIDNAIKNYYKIYNEFSSSKYQILSLFELIKYNLNKNRIEEANNLIKSLENLDKEGNLYLDALLLQAETFISLKRYSEAFSIYNYYLKNSKTEKDFDYIYYWAGYCAEEIKDFISAKYFYESLVNKYENSKFYYQAIYSLLRIYRLENNYIKERLIISKILLTEKEKDKVEQLYKRIRELELLEKGLSEEEANLLLLIEKGDIEAKLNLGKLYIRGKDREKGIIIISEIAKDRNDNFGAMANNLLGDNQLEQNNYKDALSIYLKTVQNYKATKETIAEALYKASYCYFKLENTANTLKIIERIKKDFPDTEWATKAIELEQRLKR